MNVIKAFYGSLFLLSFLSACASCRSPKEESFPGAALLDVRDAASPEKEGGPDEREPKKTESRRFLSEDLSGLDAEGFLALSPPFLLADGAMAGTCGKEKGEDGFGEAQKEHLKALLEGEEGDAQKMAHYLWLRMEETEAQGLESKALTQARLAGEFLALGKAWPLMEEEALVRASKLYFESAYFEESYQVLETYREKSQGENSIYVEEMALLELALKDKLGEEDGKRALLEAAWEGPKAKMSEEALRLLLAFKEGSEEERQIQMALIERFPWGGSAQKLLKELRPEELSEEERVKVAESLFGMGRYQALKPFIRDLKGLKDRKSQTSLGQPACDGALLLGKALERENRKKKSKKVALSAYKAYEKALNCKGDVLAWATFLGGRNRLQAGDLKTAKRLLDQHVAEFPKRTTADDALLLLVDTMVESEESEKEKALLEILSRYPDGDMAEDVAWRVLRPYLDKHDWEGLLLRVREIEALVGKKLVTRHHGRFSYWKGRALLALQKEAQAKAVFRGILKDSVLSWYAVLAASRLEELGDDVGLLMREAGAASVDGDGLGGDDEGAEAPDEDAASRDAASRDALGAESPSEDAVSGTAVSGDAVDAEDPALEVALSPKEGHEKGDEFLEALEGAIKVLREEPHFQRALLYASLNGSFGLECDLYGGLFQREWDAIPEGKRPKKEILTWMRVSLLQLAGRVSSSVAGARIGEAFWPLPFPEGEALLRWRLAYPEPYSETVKKWSEEREISPYWLYGIMRVESNFNPRAKSWASALGIMQIIMPTAEMLSKGTEHAPTRENLENPAIAIELGSKYLAKLLSQHKVIPLASAGYNAGGGSVNRWRRSFPELELDEFVENITYREARRYAKSVTQTAARYLWLNEQKMLTLSLLPPGVPD